MSKVFRNTTAYMIAGLIPNFMNLFMLPIYTRFLEPADYGLVSLVVTLTTFLSAFLGFQLHNSINRLYFDYDQDGRRAFFSTILIATIGINLLILVPLHFAGESMARLIFPRVQISYYPFILLGFIGIFFQTLTHLFNSMLRVQERGILFLATATIHTALGIALGIYFVVIRKMGAEGVLLATAINAMLTACMLFTVLRAEFRPVLRKDILKDALAYCIPLIPHSLGGILFLYTDKYILAYFVPLTSIGLYDLATKFSMMVRMMISSFNNAIMPVFMRESMENRDRASKAFRDIITVWSVVVAVLCLGVSFFAEEFILWLTPQEYYGAYEFVPILVMAFAFRALDAFAINAVMFEKKTRIIPFITFTVGLVNVVGNILLIPRFGVIAAAWTTLLAFVLGFLLSLWASRRLYPQNFAWRELSVIFGSMLTLFVVTSLLKGSSLWLNCFYKILACIAFIVFMWKKNYGGISDKALQQFNGLTKR